MNCCRIITSTSTSSLLLPHLFILPSLRHYATSSSSPVRFRKKYKGTPAYIPSETKAAESVPSTTADTTTPPRRRRFLLPTDPRKPISFSPAFTRYPASYDAMIAAQSTSTNQSPVVVPFSITRTPSQLLPVYVQFKHRDSQIRTIIRNIHGNRKVIAHSVHVFFSNELHFSDHSLSTIFAFAGIHTGTASLPRT